MSAYVPRHSQKKEEPEQGSSFDQLLSEIRAGKQAEEKESMSELLPIKKEKQKPRRARKKEEQEEWALHEQELAATSEQEFAATSEQELATTKTALLQPEDALADIIVDADKAVAEHPELANPFVVTGEIPDNLDEEALSKIRKRRWPVVIAIVLSLIVITGAVTYYVLSSQAMQRESNRAAGYDALDEAISLITESDQVIVAALDPAIIESNQIIASLSADQLPSLSATEEPAAVTAARNVDLSERQALLERIPKTLETLKGAEEYANTALGLMTAQEDKDFAQKVLDAVANRKDLLNNGEKIIGENINAITATLKIYDAWVLMSNADAELRATTLLSESTNYNNLQQAIERNSVILATLEQATALVNEASESFPAADYSAISNYITFKSQQVTLAIEADQAVLNSDLETANAKNAEFAVKDGEVVEAAKQMTDNPLSLIASAYASTTAQWQDAYKQARAKVAEADSFIREYVGVDEYVGVETGVETQTGVQ